MLRGRESKLTLALAFALAPAALLGGFGAACSASGDEPAAVDASLDGGHAAGDAAVDLCPNGVAVDYPPGPYAVETLGVLPPDLVFQSADGPVALKDYFEPCAPRSRLLVVRSMAEWCGTCDWHARHTSQLFEDPRYADRLLRLDLLIADRDNMPATTAAGKRWRDRLGANGRTAIDPAFTMSKAMFARTVLPSYVAVDTRTMKVRFTDGDPSTASWSEQVLLELADRDHQPRPERHAPSLYDDTFADNQWELIQGMRYVPAPPSDPTNEFADDPAAAALGKTLFSDVLLSPSGTVSCATCHEEGKGFADGLAQSVGASLGDRNAPSIVVAAHSRWQFWDGRADSLWMQALGPFENDKEFQSSRLFVVKRIAAAYAEPYAAVFGAKYPLPDVASLPASGKPGEPAWDALPAAQRDDVTRVFVNVGKAIAAFERTLRAKENALDRYAAGDTGALTAAQKRALQFFFLGGCQQCHWGPNLTDDAFHALRFPTGRQDHLPDRGRADVLTTLSAAEFIGSSRWSDAPRPAADFAFDAAPRSMVGAFKTASLRGVAKTAPFGHGGKFATLLDVAKHYGLRGDEVPDAETVGDIEEWVPNFDSVSQLELPRLLEILTSD